MESDVRPFRITSRLIFGLGILIVGLLWTLDNLGVVDSDAITRWWPIILVLVGIVRLMDRSNGRFGSFALIVVGVLLLLDIADLIQFSLRDLLPLGVAVLGGKLVLDALDRRSHRGTASTTDPSAVISAFAFMAGVKRQSSALAFRGGDASAIMGGVELDLRNAKIADGEEAVIDTFAFWGGVEIAVPENWRVVGKVMPLMGGFEDKTRSNNGSGPVLIVRGVALMGSVEVKN
jgi:predicted membrane protein